MSNENKKNTPTSKKIYKDVNKTLLKAIPNPATKPYEVKIKQPELTFLGVYNQPDFAVLYILMYPGKKVIELKSLKLYLQQFRNIVISYERILNGASLIQLYTSLIYKGPSIVNKIKEELVYLLKRDNYKSLDQAVGKLNK